MGGLQTHSGDEVIDKGEQRGIGVLHGASEGRDMTTGSQIDAQGIRHVHCEVHDVRRFVDLTRARLCEGEWNVG